VSSINDPDALEIEGKPVTQSSGDAWARLGETNTTPTETAGDADASLDSERLIKEALADPGTTLDLASGMQDAKKHPRDMRVDERRNAMSALARKRWEKRDRMRAATKDGALHDASTDASGVEAGAAQSRMAAFLSGSGEIQVDRCDREAIVIELRRKAKGGDVAAAKELRAWIGDGLAGDEAGTSLEDLGALDPITRSKMLAGLEQWIAEQERPH
jgi:hypothetical protein